MTNYEFLTQRDNLIKFLLSSPCSQCVARVQCGISNNKCQDKSKINCYKNISDWLNKVVIEKEDKSVLTVYDTFTIKNDLANYLLGIMERKTLELYGDISKLVYEYVLDFLDSEYDKHSLIWDFLCNNCFDVVELWKIQNMK